MTVETPEVTTPTPSAPMPKNYWGSDEQKKVYLDDGVQYFVVQKMNEGARTRFEKLTNHDMVVGANQEARVKVDPSTERHTLISQSVVNWNMYEFPTDGTAPYLGPFSKKQLELWLDRAEPKVVSDLEHEIRLFNPWMLRDMPLEEIDKELDRLTDMRKRKLEEEAGEADSATK